MIEKIFAKKIAIVGGGRFCRHFLKSLHSDELSFPKPQVLCVADINDQAVGIRYARERGIPTTNDYTQVFQLPALQVILELTNEPILGEVIRQTISSDIVFIDHFDARVMWDALQVEAVKRKGMRELKKCVHDPRATTALFEELIARFTSIIAVRNDRAKEIELEVTKQERTLAQIVQGSTIPTFVINKTHTVTHWNRALEKLSDLTAEEMVGTKRQWAPFYGNQRPTMADVILDQIDEQEIRKLYTNWRKSALINGAYESEGFFPRLGEDGKWCWFTAAPIKSPDGTIVGAIETLWDKTEDHKAEEERERHTKELNTLVSIYTALNASINIETGINQVVEEVKDFLSADGICIYLIGDDGRYHLRYGYGFSEDACKQVSVVGEESIIFQVARSHRFTLYDDLPSGCSDEICFLEDQKLRSLVYVPISSKEHKTFGVIRIGSHWPKQFSHDQRDILELIGNRIGVAIENSTLQEQVFKSEKKYRWLFNNDPNPTFIIGLNTLGILDTNLRAQDCYGYTRKEITGFTFLDLGDPGDDEVAQGLAGLAPDQSILFSKKRHYRKGHLPFFVNISVSRGQYGEQDVLIATTTDITETVEKEAQFIQAGKMATLGVMAAGMAHEINQPLNVIQICADFFLKMLKKGQTIADEDLEAMAKDIVANVQRATGVIRHVRDFARQSEVVGQKVNVNDPIRDVFKVLGHQIKVHQIELELDLAPDLPAVMAEHNRLEQVFINLVSNAIDAMDERAKLSDARSVEKRLRIKSFSQNDHVVVTVSDTGTGMTEEIQQKVFEPFFTTKKTGKGTGLGTSISYGIITDYKGTITVESTVGQGTTFTVTFPALG